MSEIASSKEAEGKSNQTPHNPQSKSKYHFIPKLISFMKSHTIYEAIPANMKVTIYFIIDFSIQ